MTFNFLSDKSTLNTFRACFVQPSQTLHTTTPAVNRELQAPLGFTCSSEPASDDEKTNRACTIHFLEQNFIYGVLAEFRFISC